MPGSSSITIYTNHIIASGGLEQAEHFRRGWQKATLSRAAPLCLLPAQNRKDNEKGESCCGGQNLGEQLLGLIVRSAATTEGNRGKIV